MLPLPVRERAALEKEGSSAAIEEVGTIDAEVERLRSGLDEQLEQWRKEKDLLGRIRQEKETVQALLKREEELNRGFGGGVAAPKALPGSGIHGVASGSDANQQFVST